MLCNCSLPLQKDGSPITSSKVFYAVGLKEQGVVQAFDPRSENSLLNNIIQGRNIFDRITDSIAPSIKGMRGTLVAHQPSVLMLHRYQIIDRVFAIWWDATANR
jgi:hypothetical protein